MEGGDGGDGSTPIRVNSTAIKAAQQEMGRLDVLVCGQCHSVFHFVDEFQEHRSKEGACSKVSSFRENSNNEQKAQVWAFLLWKDTQIQQDSPDKDNSWKLYQKWCKMDTHVRDCWITAGKTIQTFTKISNTKMQEVPRQQGGKTVVVRKIIRNGQPESPEKKEFKPDIKIKTEPTDNKGKVKLKPSIKPKEKTSDAGENNAESSGEEYAVEKILAKRFNPKKKVYEYLLKWEGYAHEHNTWEEVTHVSVTCKQLMDEFEQNLAKQKELKAQQVAKSINRANQMNMAQKIVKVDNSKAGPSSAAQAGRPMRSSKSKALDQVKQWCGSMKDEDNDLLGKRKIAFTDSDSDDDGGMGSVGNVNTIKRSKHDTSGDDDWTAESEEDKVVMGRSDVIQRAFSRANAQSNGSNRSSGPMTGTDLANSMLANKNIVNTKATNAQPQSNVYIVHRKDGIIKLDSSPTNKISVKGPNQSANSGVLMVQNRDGVMRKQIVSAGALHSNSITPVKVTSKADGTQVVTQMKVVPKSTPAKTGAVTAPKNEPIKIQPKPDPNQMQQIHLVTAVPSPLGIQTQRVTSAVRPTGQRTADGRPLLPRPAGIRSSTPSSSNVVSITQTRTPIRAPPPKQIIQQKRTTPTSTIVQVSSPNTLTSIKPKITVMNQQGKVIQKTVVSPAQATRPIIKTTPVSRNQSLITPQQKMMMARRKVAEQAGVLAKSGARGGSTTAARGGARPKGRLPDTTSTANKPKESKLAETDGLHMEFHEIESEESSSEGEPDFPPVPAEPAQPAEPDSPPRQFTLCPHTGRIIGPDGEPLDQPEPEPEPAPAPTPMAIVQVSATGTTVTADGIITSSSNANDNSAELVLPNLDSLTDATGGIVRVEMSPGGTTGTIVQANDPTPITLNAGVVVPGPDLPCLDDPSIEVQTTSTGGVVVNVPPIAMPETTAVTTTTVGVVPTVPATAVVTTATTTTTAEPTGLEAIPSTETAILPDVTKEEMITGSTEIATTEATTAGTNVKMEESGGLVTITGDDGVVYQVTGQAEDGQTLLVTRGPDGEQQCVYVTTEQQAGEDGSVLTLDHAVAEAVAQLMPDQVNLTPQFYVKEGTDGTVEGAEVGTADNQQMVMSIMDSTNTVVATGQEDSENQAQVVAQVIQADEPTPGGTRRVVLLLPDGNLMMTEVDEEQYAALELDK
ncbi:uncharacterized protein LOC100114613 isoform X2 [Nasonia vitripennis]|uniref:Chromo domain-containing protein n=1 Tax=Nasonia vitripennis TaxID=7425 RepID=A0A7M7QPY2_NASVI|nr:uncharacterized protein LOC100114613 isoform X2 [Nasonia vitripennis]XP_032452268.1 uncharacterized protein LOC100114613 isoform X2 [Nasonia vitripennis]